MNNQNIVTLETDRKQQAESFARGGIKAMGICMALTSNEHPIVRLSGLTLSVFPKSSKALIPLTICLGGWLLAKDKKKAFIQRAFCFGSTISVAGIIGYENEKI